MASSLNNFTKSKLESIRFIIIFQFVMTIFMSNFCRLKNFLRFKIMSKMTSQNRQNYTDTDLI